jgi:hypothetical protein
MYLHSFHRKALTIAAFTTLAAGISAQVSSQVQTQAHPAVRITRPIDGSVTTLLAGTHPAVVERAVIGARLAASKPLSHMKLLLSPSDDQELALRTLMDQQQDKTSANFHKWLTPVTYGQYFGVSSEDVAQITAWLQGQGFTVESVATGRRIITFSGNVGQVESAFHTQMNHVTVDGEAHISNTTDIAVPQALEGVVRGVSSLNDFFPKSNAAGFRKVEVPNAPVPNYVAGEPSPQYTSTSSGSHYVTPGDAAIIYNSTPLLGAGIDGTGQTIAVLGRTDITLSDVQQFRSMFGLKKNDPTFTIIGEDPGINTDDIEAYLDVEWSGGMAPGASVNFIVGGSDYETESGIGSAGLYAVDNNIGDIITLSYGGCETINGASGTAFWNTLWEQAAAQGQTAFISSGDSSAAGCSSSSAAYGAAYGVNALGSSAYNVAVGGTMFVDYGPSQYWTTGSIAPVPAAYSFTTATSYIPEAPWNQGLLSTTYLNTLSTAAQTGSGIAGGGGGISIYTARPSWQVGSGISTTADPTNCVTTINGACMAASSPITGLHRLVPDISFIAASGHDATAFCAESSCYSTSTGYGIGAVGGTSVATPVMASVQALINQKNGGRQGNANFYFYQLANTDYNAGTCKSANGTAASPTVVLPGAGCNFHDVVTGSNIVPTNATGTTSVGFSAATGFDPASGLGSVNIANVATDWSKVSFNATATAFTLTPTTVTTHGTSQNFTVTVSSSAGTPTGDFSIIAVTTNPGTQFRFTLSSGAYSGTLAGLPAGSYNVHAHYEGDGTFSPSDSNSIAVNIGQESSSVSFLLTDFYPGYVQTGQTSIPYGYLIDLIGNVAGASATGTPSGTLTFAINRSGTTLTPFTGKLDSSGNAALVAGAGYSSLYVAPNYPVLAPGSYVVTGTYSGDSSFKTSSNSTAFTITQYNPTVTLTSSAAYITSGAPVNLTASIGVIALTPSLAAYPTGTVIFTDTTSGTTLGTATLNSAGIASLLTSAIFTSGANTITATYNGDTNYASATSTAATVTVGTLTSTATTLSVASGTYYVLTSTPLTATVAPAVSGTVRFYDGGVLLGSATSSATTGIATLSATTFTAGTHSLMATFAGTSAYTASSGSTTLSVAQNVTSTILDAPTKSAAGQTITLNGRVARSPTQSSAGTVLLTGTVTFYDAFEGTTTAIATATPVYLPGGYYYYVATGSTGGLTRGTHTITASYSGDANFAASASSSVTLTVVPNTVWIANSAGTVSAITPSGATVANSTGGGVGVAIDNSGDIWSINHGGSSIAEFSSNGSVLSSGYTGGGITTPTALALDGSGMVWIANSNSTVSVLSATGNAVSGSSGYPTTTSTPSSLSIDASGNLWITNAGDNSLTEVIGAAAPVTTPTTKAVSNNTLAAKP